MTRDWVHLERVLRTHVAAARKTAPAVDRLHRWGRDRARPVLFAAVRDSTNRLRYGRGAPRFAELIWVSPAAVESVALGAGVRNSGRVTETWWDESAIGRIEADPVYQAAVARWVDGQSWESTGEVERMRHLIARKGAIKGLRTKADIHRRCASLDALFDTIQRDGRLRTQAELEPRAFREFGGIGVHVGPDGRLVRAENGRHRFAIARILDLPTMPARLGLVHRSALTALPGLRSGPC